MKCEAFHIKMVCMKESSCVFNQLDSIWHQADLKTMWRPNLEQTVCLVHEQATHNDIVLFAVVAMLTRQIT